MKKLLFLLLLSNALLAQPRWPAVTQQAKPWTRWWWMGSAVNPKDLTSLMTQYQKAGLGGVEITPIYGVQGSEKQFIDFLSPKWMSMLDHTLKEANRIGLGVDLAQASGWPFGGPWVSPEDACKYVVHKTFTLKSGETLTEPVTYIQKPIMRTVGEKIDIKEVVEPIAKNPNLQRHAFDQVRFEKPLPLVAMMAYSDNGRVINLTTSVDSTGKLNWTAPEGTWILYAVFQGWHGKMVERAGPGGEGDVIDHFSKTATQNYLKKFDTAFKGHDLKNLRAFFNDSYEVDDAQGESNWTPALFNEFVKRRGYDLRHQLVSFFAKGKNDRYQRVLTDYRETISELLLENYTKTWSDWAKGKGKIIRNQAHGSPANILDLYAITDIPEIEGTEMLRIKFASSAANVTGKKLTSSESATWDNEHFLSKLSDIKKDMDRFLLGGVNHTFYHGTNYSPQEAAWPGWLFYAAVHFNPNNSFWADFGKLNQYVARCQSFLQAGKPNNDVLVYLPIYDAFARPARELLQHFDGIEHGFKGLPVEKHAEALLKKGYSFDFISDKQLMKVTAIGGKLQTGGVTYQTILVPEAQLIPLETLQQLMKLAQSGAKVVFANELPQDVPGWGKLALRQNAFNALITSINFEDAEDGLQKARVGKGAFWVANDLEAMLTAAGVKREKMVDTGLQVVRRSHANGNYYFIANWGNKAVDGWVPISVAAKSVALYNPMTEKLGLARFRTAGGVGEVYLQLAPGESCILETSRTAVSGPAYAYLKPAATGTEIKGTWAINFVEGGPQLPTKKETAQLASWTELEGDDVKKFSGTATYTISFPKPEGTGDGWLLDLGKVAESARVQLNGKEIGTLIGPTYQVFIPKDQLKPTNMLTVFVSNSMANRIADMDREHINWKKFYNINMSARLRENRGADGNFTAEKWKPLASGLLGPVTLTPVVSGK
ncbi:glycosyl hydrolase [Larkinella humicola]|uniref:Glycoside hydrolase family 2 protein n=1 Tax=Larkinella humicola TaxID=2607654 RepID=A0A5N1J3C7_9BACT|nr:glycosyl hydrolase [Larkinella humicola]KAA9345421.1 glycoside hydrolase family 2 protein [Larkinella humicola]